MLFDGIDFFNVSELERRDGMPGWILHRFPKALREQLQEDVCDLCRSVELRFVLEPLTQRGTVYVCARTCDGEAVVFYGDYQQAQVIPLPKGVITPVDVRFPEALAKLPEGRFSSRLCRIFLNSRTQVSYVGREWLHIRPPMREETPEKLLVGYGSSITHGGLARSNCNCYLQLAARRLRMDALNYGLSGSCTADACIADYIAQDPRGDAFLIELGANMVGRYTADEYEARAAYTLERIAGAHADKPVLAVALYPSSYEGEEADTYPKRLAQAVKRIDRPNLHLLEGRELLPDITGLSTDGLHPSDWGHMVMGEHLAAQLAGLTAAKGEAQP